jgi:hypothetical protein
MHKACNEIYSFEKCFDYLKSLDILSTKNFHPGKALEIIAKLLQQNNFSFAQNLLSNKLSTPPGDQKISRFFTDYPVYFFYFPGVVITKNRADSSYFAIKCFPSSRKEEEFQRKCIQSLSKLQHRYITRFFSCWDEDLNFSKNYLSKIFQTDLDSSEKCFFVQMEN